MLHLDNDRAFPALAIVSVKNIANVMYGARLPVYNNDVDKIWLSNTTTSK